MQSSGFDDQKIEDIVKSSYQTGLRGTERVVVLPIKWGGRAVSFVIGKKTLDFVLKPIKKLAKKIGKAIWNGLKALAKAIPKEVWIVIGIITAVIIVLGFLYFCAYYYIGEDNGLTGNKLDHGNIIAYDEEGDVNIVPSNANANCDMYYNLVSRNKSVWQVYNDNGKEILIRNDDERAVSDYFKNDQDFYIEPNLLYEMNEYIYGNTFCYPESFLNPVNYNKEDFTLVSLVDEDGNVTCDSDCYTKSGIKRTKTIKSVSDYGIASVLLYKEETEKKYFKGTYCKQEVLNEKGDVVVEEINEPFNFSISQTKVNVMDKAVTFAGDVQYVYEPSTTRTTSVSSGKSSYDESEPTEIYIYYEGTVNITRCTRKITDENGAVLFNVTGFSTKDYPQSKNFMQKNEDTSSGYTQEEIDSWIAEHSTEFEYEPGKIAYITYSKISNFNSKNVKLRKYRSADSGVYVDFVNQKEVKSNDLGNKYLYDYLKNFSAYKPVNVYRDYNVFRTMSSQASDIKSVISTNEKKYKIGNGKNKFERVYNGSEEGRTRLEMMWDMLVDWGYTKEQAAAIMGNIAQESTYNPLACNQPYQAYGICQWRNGRKRNLFNFAGSLGRDWSDLEAQITYASMELEPYKKYSQCNDEWAGHDDLRKAFAESDDIEELTLAIRKGWERCGEGEANDSERISSAQSAYETFKGREIVHEAMHIAPIGEDSADNPDVNDTSAYTKNMSEADKKSFNTFYHQVDNIFDGNTQLVFYSVALTEEDIIDMLRKTNAYINRSTLSEERLNTLASLWTDSFLTNLNDEKKKKEVADIYGVDYLDKPRLVVESVKGLEYYYGSGNPFNTYGRSGDWLGLPNCTTFAFARRWEITGVNPGSTICHGNAYAWFDYNKEGGYYKYGSTPKAGAIMVWGNNINSKAASEGHVAIVEQINEDGTMTITQSGFNTPAWDPYNVKTGTIENVEYWKASMHFYGYIYLEPMSD